MELVHLALVAEVDQRDPDIIPSAKVQNSDAEIS